MNIVKILVVGSGEHSREILLSSTRDHAEILVVGAGEQSCDISLSSTRDHAKILVVGKVRGVINNLS